MKSFARVGALALVMAASAAFGQSFTLVDNGSTAVINTTGAAGIEGLVDWHMGAGPNHVFQQVYALSINGGAVVLPSQIGSPVANQPIPALLNVSYTNAPTSLEMSIRYLLTGSGTTSSDIAEVVSFFNRGNSAVTIKLFEYDDFDLNGTPSDDTALLVNSSTIQQFDPSSNLFVGTVPVPTAWQIGSTGTVTNAVLAGALNNTGSPTGPSDVAFAFQWNFTINPGESWQMSKDKRLSVVPEPCSLLALGGLSALAVLRRRRRS